MRKIARLAVSSALLGASALTATAVGAANASAAPSPASLCPDANIAMFGPNVCVFTPSMSETAIQADVNAIYTLQVGNQFGTDRYALFFEPGTYGTQSSPLDIPVGYYTEVDGLGQDPSDVVINGGVTAVGMNGSGALDIFWRSVSNLTIHVVPVAPGDCHTSNEMWAVSQAAPMRRVDVKDFTTFMPYCENPNFASGATDWTASSGVISQSRSRRSRSRSTAASSASSRARLPVHCQWVTNRSRAAPSGSSSTSPRPVFTKAAVALSDTSVSWAKAI